MSDLSTLTLNINTLEKGYLSRQFTPVDVIREVYARIKKSGDLGIWTYLIPENESIAYANQLIQETAGEDLPLFGIPFCVKDNIHVANLPTTASCPAFKQYPQESATVVNQLLRAGAILIGKNTMDQFATGLVGIRSPIHPHNPFNKDYIPGGSSSGSAVAVSTGMVSFSLGSDTGGSGRIPAALNNIIGLKPTPGLVSSHGMIYANRSFDCVPIFALYIDDVQKILNIISGFDYKDPFSSPKPIVDEKKVDLDTPIKIGIPNTVNRKFFEDSLAELAYQQALQLAEQQIGEIIEIDYSPFIEASQMLFDGPLIAERLASLESFITSNPQDVHEVVSGLVKKASSYSAVDLCKAYYRLKEIKVIIDRLFTEIDVMLVPTAGTIYKIDEVKKNPIELNANMGYYTYYANMLKLAAIAMPASIREDGLPFGVCFVGNTNTDNFLINLARKWERCTNLKPGI